MRICNSQADVQTQDMTTQKFFNYLRDILIEENTAEETQKEAESEFGLQKIVPHEFTRFQKLPLEVRIPIWNYAREEAAGPRVVEIQKGSCPRTGQAPTIPEARQTALSNLRRVNKEAYDVVMEKYTAISCRDLVMHPEGFKAHDHLLLDLKTDIVLFSGCWCNPITQYGSQVFTPRLESHAAKLEIVAMNVTSCPLDEMTRQFIQPILKGLKKIILIISTVDHQYLGVPISFTEVKDKEDQDYIHALREWNRWIEYLENPGHMKSVEVVIAKATRINPPKLLSMMVERRYNQVRCLIHNCHYIHLLPNLTAIRRNIPTTPLNGICTLLRRTMMANSFNACKLHSRRVMSITKVYFLLATLRFSHIFLDKSGS
jgi:hypothetical protein